ncbi:MAG: exodeoxyribonuclease VII large subunit, partial [Anaerolineales bacterium]
MNQLPLFQPASWTVTDLTQYLRELIESDSNLGDLWVQGEVSNVSRPTSGHLYFTLKDAGAALRCVMWRNTVSRQTFVPQAGDAIEAHGSIGIYEVSGQYQLYADWIRPAGEGALYQEFLRLKARLEAEGLFDASRKRPIPRWPHRIGLVTSPTGAALRDMLNTLRRRYPMVKAILSPTPVQGADAPPRIAAAFQDLHRPEPSIRGRPLEAHGVHDRGRPRPRRTVPGRRRTHPPSVGDRHVGDRDLRGVSRQGGADRLPVPAAH